jgi:ketosteroid isomerase-like protein
MAVAIRSKNVEATLLHYAPDVVSFDVVGPLQFRGSAAIRQRLEEWFASFKGPIEYESSDAEIAASGAIAFCHSLNHVSGTLGDGRKLEMWWRATLGFRKHEGAWRVSHSHSSVPFDPKSGKASLDLKP